MPGSLIGRADLLRLLVAGYSDDAIIGAMGVLGAALRSRPEATTTTTVNPTGPEPSRGPGKVVLAEPPVTFSFRPIPVWAQAERRQLAPVPIRKEGSGQESEEKLDRRDEPRPIVDRLPRPVLSRGALARKIDRLLARPEVGARVDLAALTNLLARRVVPERLPRRRRRRLPRELALVLDRRQHLVPITADQDRLRGELRSRWGGSRLHVHELFARADLARVAGKIGHTAALVISDLDLDRARATVDASWRGFLASTARRSAHLALLSPRPVPGSERTKLPRGLAVETWDRARIAPLEPMKEPAAMVLRLLSLATSVEPALLRATRLLLGAEGASLADELDVWAAFARPNRFGATLDLAERRRRRAELEAVLAGPERELLHRVIPGFLDLLVAFHGQGSPFVLREELLQAIAILPEELTRSLDASADWASFRRLAASVDGLTPELRAAFRAWLEKVAVRAPRQFLDHPEAHASFHEARRRLDLQDEDASLTAIDVVLLAGTRFALLPAGEAPAANVLGRLGLGHAMLALGGASHDGTSRARPGATIDLADDRDSFSIQSDQERLAFRRLVRPEWCSAFGRGRDGRPFLEVGPSEERIRFIWQEDGERLDADTTVGGWRVEPGSLPAGVVRAGLDAHGAWIEIAPRGVGCRLRWIPPGRFLMGSPVTEAGRFHDEEQHEEEIGRGFWLGATPVTQAFFESIMAQNPSRFRSPERPVESLSWNEAAAFIERTSALVPALALRLPTEVEWEYACRAGTTTATYAGDLEILGERNAPRLDAIAWYGGNSGVGWDLEEGHDSSAWPEKQFPHQRAGTRPVGLKKANAWGLQDMLGNVWEWCADLEMGTKAGRVFRGGSWYGRFRNLRAATRHALVVDGRDSSLGLRIARGSSDFRSRPAGESVSGGQLGEPRPKEARRARKKKQ